MTLKKRSIASLLLALSLNLTLNASPVRADSDPEASAPVSPDFVLLSAVKIKPERIVDFKRTLLPYAGLTRTEPGNVAYLAHQSPDDPTVFEMYEHWASDPARSTHLAADYTVQFFAAVKPMFEAGYPIRTKFIELK